MNEFGIKLGKLLGGGETIELVGDVGAGKTTLVRGIAEGMGIDEVVQSPTFTVSRIYTAPHNRRLAHYDFYRLNDPGIMADELFESAGSDDTVVIVEWAGSVDKVLPADRLSISISAPSESTREITMYEGGPVSQHLILELS